ncbi:Bromodomain-containing protein [Kockovaella imperatae]|uniref:Bromodomain-containing protein n=1 Tax=Kockovaella imperatae TaxID=4999 RepID=A0A1Y1UUE0_9TREE|nr:Bromodomain-containing protein [Kockovaella imperatae]ORX41076.1 Bromodomain-containing protein [Kockovaella imperatae]
MPDVKDEEGDKSMEREDSGGPSGTGDGGRSKKRRNLRGVDPSLIISQDRSKRRKTPTPEPEARDSKDAVDPKDKDRAKRLGMEIYEKIMASKDKEGGSMAEPFIKLPNKRSFPDYYETIPHPISLEMVHARLQSSSYETLGAVCSDLGQIFWNAKRYNVKESLIFQYAKKLHKMTKAFQASATASSAKIESESEAEAEPEPEEEEEAPPMDREVSRDSGMADTSMEVDEGDVGGQEGGPSNASMDGESQTGGAGSSGRKGIKRGAYMKDGPTVYKLVKPVLRMIKEAKARDGSGREIAGIFMDLPDREELPDYYTTITSPISLSNIESKMVARLYNTHEQFFDDLDLMCANAFTYNEDDSEVFRDAQQIKTIADGQRLVIRDRLNHEEAMKSRFPAAAANPMRYGGPAGPLPQYQQSPAGAPRHGYNTSGIPPNPPQRAPYLQPLPRGVVNEDIVASLSRYPVHEQSAWVNSLPPQGMQIYRSIVSANENRRRTSITPSMPSAQTHSPSVVNGGSGYGQLAELPSSARPGGVSPLTNRQAPPYPTVKHLDFAFATPDSPPERRQMIRLYNLRGVVTHAVILGPETTELEVTAYVADEKEPVKDTNANGIKVESPDVSLRINGTLSGSPELIYSGAVNGADASEGGSPKPSPVGMKWKIAVPPGKIDNKLEIVAVKSGSTTETTLIYMTKQ